MRRHRDDCPQVSPPDELDPSKKPRRSERISSLSQRHEAPDPNKTPIISNKQHLPSPLTNHGLTTEETSDPYTKEAIATPPAPGAGGAALARPSQGYRAATEEAGPYSHSQPFSSPPQDTQAFPSQLYADARNAALSEEVQDEVKEGVWGYLFPLDTRYGRSIVLKKRTACPLPDMEKFRGNGKGKDALLKEEADYERSKVEGIPSGGYLIGRHPECGTSRPTCLCSIRSDADI